MSESSPASRSVIGRLQELRGEVDHLRLLSVGKETKGGSLAYTGRVEESAAHSATPSRDGLDTPMFTAPNTQRRPPSNRVSDNRSSVGGVNGGRRKAIDEEDAFMAVRPAEVEEGWGTKSAAGDTVVNDKENEGHVQMGNVAARAAALEEASKSNSEADAPSADADEIAKGRPEETEALATTRRLFQQSMFEEAEKSEGTLDEPDRNHRRSIMSAPDLELPLSDSDM